MSNNPQPTVEERAEQVATDLERLAAFVRANPDLNDLDDFGRQRLLVSLSLDDNPRATMADYIRRAHRAGATVRKQVSEKFAGADLLFGAINVHVYADRDQVCERVVVATREETVEEPDPEELAKVPTVKRTVTVEDVEWQCQPILAATQDEPTVAVKVGA